MEAQQKENPLQHGSGSALLDTYLQFITENSFGKNAMMWVSTLNFLINLDDFHPS